MIFTYIAAENPIAGKRLVDGLLAKMRWIADFGFSGHSRDDLAPGLRSLVHQERCIFYRIDDEEVRIVRILHGRRDLFSQNFSDI